MILSHFLSDESKYFPDVNMLLRDETLLKSDTFPCSEIVAEYLQYFSQILTNSALLVGIAMFEPVASHRLKMMFYR